MKKSTLFFKVMVLMALLVPWTSWGQDSGLRNGDITTNKLPDFVEDFIDYQKERYWADRYKGLITITLDNEGYIVDAGDLGKYDAKTRQVTVSLEKTDYLSEWKFKKNDNKVVIKHTWASSEPSDFFPITSSSNKTITIKNDSEKRAKEPKHFWIEIGKEGKRGAKDQVGYILVWFKKGGQTDIDITSPGVSVKVDYKEGATKEYDGDPIPEISDIHVYQDGEEIEKPTNYTISYKRGEETVSAPVDVYVDSNGEAKAYDVYLTITEGDKNYTAGKTVKVGTYTITKRTLTIKANEISPATVGEEKTLTAEDFMIENNTVAKDKVVLTGSVTVNTEKAGSVTISKDELMKNLKVSGAESEYRESNYKIVYPEAGVTVDVKAKMFDSDDYEVTFEGTQDSKTYDGQPIPTVTVKSKSGETVDASNYDVTYSTTDGKNPTDAGKYTVTIKGKGNYTGELTKTFTISKRIVRVVPKEDPVEMIWIKGQQVLDPNEYLTFAEMDSDNKDGFVGGQGATFTGTLTASEDGAGYILTRGAETDEKYVNVKANDGTNLDNYTVEWGDLAANGKGISADKGNAPTTSEGEDITITDGEKSITLTEGENTVPYIGKVYTITQLGGKDLNGEDVTDKKIIASYNGGSATSDFEIKNAGVYKITIEYTDDEGNTHKGIQTVEVMKAVLTVTVLQQKLTVTELSSEAIKNSELKTAIEESEDEDKATVTIDGEQGDDKVEFKEGSVISFVTPQDAEWIVGKNASALTAKTGDATLTLAEPFATNYELKLNPGDLILNYEINEDNKDKVEFVFSGGGNTKYYDAVPVTGEDVTVKVNGVGLKEGRDYNLSFGEGVTTSIKDASDYMITVNFTGYYSGSVQVAYKIVPRPLKLQFSFDSDIQEGENLKLGDNVSLEVAADASEDNIENMGFAANEANEFNGWLKDGSIFATFKVHTEAVDGKYPVELETITFPKEGENLKYSNYDVTYIVMGADLKPSEEHPLLDEDEQTPNEDGDYTHEGDDDDIIGGFEPVDNSGHGTITGTNYRKNRLYLADRDFYFNDFYDEKGLVLYSRHDKKYAEDGGSFTIWYEHNGEVNEGGYRIFISSKQNKDYKEVKLDEVSGYYQIRNVQSDIYVKIYAMDGFPVANEEITATDARAYAQANKIVVITPEPTDVQIISMAGAVVATDQVTGQREFANLAEGVYIVRMGETVIKLQVRN